MSPHIRNNTYLINNILKLCVNRADIITSTWFIYLRKCLWRGYALNNSDTCIPQCTPNEAGDPHFLFMLCVTNTLMQLWLIFQKKIKLRFFCRCMSRHGIFTPWSLKKPEDEINKRTTPRIVFSFIFSFEVYKCEQGNAHYSAIKWKNVPKRVFLVSPVAAKGGRWPPLFISFSDAQ